MRFGRPVEILLEGVTVGARMLNSRLVGILQSETGELV